MYNYEAVNKWEELFRPVNNHLDENAGWQDDNGNGIMFETYGEQLDYVAEQNPHNVWTYTDGEDGTFIQSGLHVTNRIGYFVTENQWTAPVHVQVTDPFVKSVKQMYEQGYFGDVSEGKGVEV